METGSGTLSVTTTAGPRLYQSFLEPTVCSNSLALDPSCTPNLHQGAILAVQTYEAFFKAWEQNQAVQSYTRQQANSEQQGRPLKARFSKKRLREF